MATKRDAIFAPKALKPNGNYSHAVRAGPLLLLAGWMGDDPQTGKIVEGGIEAQTVGSAVIHQHPGKHRPTDYQWQQAINNIRACLEAAGPTLDKVMRRRIYMIDMSELRKADRIWSENFSEPLPVSTCIQIGTLTKEGALVERLMPRRDRVRRV